MSPLVRYASTISGKRSTPAWKDATHADVIVGADVHQRHHLEVDRGRVDQRHTTRDHTIVFERLDPSPTRRRREPDLVPELASAQRTVRLQQTHNIPIDFIHNRRVLHDVNKCEDDLAVNHRFVPNSARHLLSDFRTVESCRCGGTSPNIRPRSASPTASTSESPPVSQVNSLSPPERPRSTPPFRRSVRSRRAGGSVRCTRR